MIYRTIVFGHRKCSGMYRVFIGVREGGGGYRNHRGNILAIWAMRGEHTSPQGVARPPMVGGRIGEGEEGVQPPSFSSSPSFLLRWKKERGALGETPSRIRTLRGAHPGCSPPPPTYIYVGRGRLEHTTTIVSRVRRPPPQFTPPVISS